MASTPASNINAPGSPLIEALATALPKDCQFTAWHLSTTPRITEALCYPPALNSKTDKRPSKPLKTYCEKHFLAVSINEQSTSKDVLVLAVEIYIYTTAFSTTIFVAKADSTGYLNLQSSPKGFSPIRAITIAFLEFLIRHRKRPTKQLVVNLFARAQSQYLFPGSVKNEKKHVLDDRGLIKWWCRVLNPLLEEESSSSWDCIHGYLVIPGLDDYETRAFVPRTQAASQNWTLGHPLEHTSPYTSDPATFGKSIPPRCLIPTYPDDPKARFVQELEETTAEKAKLVGGWKSPKTLEQFWEMMAFRQECSSGRMTGFIWLVFDPKPPKASASAPAIPTPAASFSGTPADVPSTPTKVKSIASLVTPTSSPSKLKISGAKLPQRKRRSKKVLKGVIIPRKPHIKTHNKIKYPDQIETPYYYWPEAGRGKVVLDDNGYKRAVELLLHLEFRGLEQAVASTSRWINEVNMGEPWRIDITGTKDVPVGSASPAAAREVNNLSGAIKRRRPHDADDAAKENTSTTAVNTLAGGSIRKKPKVEEPAKEKETKVNTLGAGLIRKKAKTVAS
ncbi:hypothetical protein F5Y16DRAFT_364963 [Xylariaceae sp. FL0255]|nr:hypothetical protein F5Y16DRAFT_364963 [Xylariaceae sp. FL0255]